MSASTPRAVLVDLDGTVVHGDRLVPGADEALRAVRAAGAEVLFLTNNPARSPAEQVSRLADLGVEADPGEVLTSAVATVEYLAENHEGADALALVGERVREQLRSAPVTFVEDPAAATLVVAGYDEAFDYEDMRAGLQALLGGAPLVGTDPDRWAPTDDGPVPVSGAVINAVAGAAEVEPEAVLGKPSPETTELALDRLGVPAEECLLVGDRIGTDVAMGERAGMRTALVLTGASGEADLEDAEVRPDHVLDSLADLERLL